MKAPRFDYRLARTPQEAFELLAGAEDPRLLAGGQSLIAALNLRLSQPDLLVDVSRIQLWQGIELCDGGLRIGALTTHAQIEHSALVARHAPLLHAAAPYIAHPGIRNRGTIGGSICLADPAAEWPACLVALDAIFTLQSAKGERTIPARQFFRELYETALEPGEILTFIHVPVPQAGSIFLFDEVARRPGDYAVAGLALAVRFDGQTIAALDLGFLGLGNTPLRAEGFSSRCIGLSVPEAVALVRDVLAEEITPNSDHHASAAYRLQLAVVLTQRLLMRAAQQAGLTL